MLRHIATAALLICALPLSAQITLEQIRSKPPSNARNFMIWQYFDQNITSEQADEALYLIRDVNLKLFFAYANKSDRPEVAYTAKCLQMDTAALKETSDASCARLAVSIGRLSAMTPEERNRIGKLLDDPGLTAAIGVLNEPELSRTYRTYPPKLFLRVFNGSYGFSRRRQFNFIPDYDYLQRLSKSPGFTSAVMSAIDDGELSRFAWALTKVEGKGLDARGLFYLGLNQLKRGTKARAIELFQRSRDKAYYQEDKDKALFWQALSSGNDLIWMELAESWDINFYVLYAKEKVRRRFPENIFSHVQTSEQVSDLNLSDPFVWHDLLEAIRHTPKLELYDLVRRYNAKNLIPLQSFIIERASDFRMQSYIMPYAQELTDVDTDTKALIYALMRQESRFIPAALSRSYALGLMQMMPFLCRAMDDQVDCGRERLEEMFEPHVNLLYAKPHVAWLKKRVYHPLFVAYAYNGGIGFTKRHLLNGTFEAGPYEPFMSMELMRRTETREYGKKVLTNYVVYKKLLGEPVSLIGLCRKLLLPEETDRFRSAK